MTRVQLFPAAPDHQGVSLDRCLGFPDPIRFLARPAGIIVVTLVLATSARAQFTLSRIFDDPTITNRDRFGISMALKSNRVLIGREDDTNGLNVGQAHLFDISGSPVQVFDDPTPTNQDRFGHAVALDAGFALIGAPNDDTNGTDTGQAHLFDVTNGNLLQTLHDPTPTDADRFGSSVAQDGNLTLVGAPGDDTQGIGIGQAHLFDATTGAPIRTFDDPTVTDFDNFGESVAINAGRVLIGASGDSTASQSRSIELTQSRTPSGMSRVRWR